MKIEDFKGKRVTVMGIGLHGGGVGVIKFFHQAGANVLATDLRPRRELRESLAALFHLKGVTYVLGQHREKDFIETDLVIKNPAVPDDSLFLKIAQEHGVKIDTDVGIFFELCPGQIIGITGTRGKSTTAALIYQFLKTKYPDTVLAGNIRASVLGVLPQIKKTTLAVLELSSWQLNGLAPHKKSPPFAVITNILPDHLNRYASMEQYIADKKIIYEFQNQKNFLILNFDDQILKSFASQAKSKIYYFAGQAPTSHPQNLAKTQQELRIGAYLTGGKIFFGAHKEKITEISRIKLLGQHNLTNVLAAVTVARLYDIPIKSIKNILQEFSGLEGRLQVIREVKGVKYVNDTAATIPEATIAAINTLTDKLTDSLTNKLILIAGGADKKLNFDQLAKVIVKKVKTLILLEGTATDKLHQSIKNELLVSQLAGKKLKIIKTNTMERAVKLAASQAKAGDCVLLSPACASFGLFRHEFERGEKFNEAIEKLPK